MEPHLDLARPSSRSAATDEDQVRERLQSWATSIRMKDSARVLSHYAPNVPTFNLGLPTRYADTGATRKGWESWSSSFDGPIGYELVELAVSAGREVAFAHSLNHVTGKRKDGTAVDMWLRATIGLRKIDGLWLFAHEHYSVPIEMTSRRAIFDAAP